MRTGPDAADEETVGHSALEEDDTDDPGETRWVSKAAP